MTIKITIFPTRVGRICSRILPVPPDSCKFAQMQGAFQEEYRPTRRQVASSGYRLEAEVAGSAGILPGAECHCDDPDGGWPPVSVERLSMLVSMRGELRNRQRLEQLDRAIPFDVS